MRAIAIVVVAGVGVTSPAAFASDRCPNAELRTGPSASLPDCRAYELVSPDLNHASLTDSLGVDRSGDRLGYRTRDAPDKAVSAQALGNNIVARRDAATGWHDVSLSPPLPGPVKAYGSWATKWTSPDLSITVEESDQPLSGGSVPSGKNVFVSRPDGTYRVVTTVGTLFQPGSNTYQSANVAGGTPDGSTFYFQPTARQLPADPVSGFNTYAWSADRGLRLVGILPDGAPAPNGASFVGNSDDGRRVAFATDGNLYLRTDDAQTVEIGDFAPDVQSDPHPTQAFLTADGAKALFVTDSPQTPDANPVGRDLYSYDAATGHVADLVADTDPAGSGAGVQHVFGVTRDGSHIYFTATGRLAPGSATGQTSLYVWHDGAIDFVAKADGMIGATYMTPDGRQFAFASTDSITGYDNSDPRSGVAHAEVFLAALGSSVECVSCQVDGQRPTGDSTVPQASTVPVRVVSDDGRRVFFHSTDAIVPQASAGTQQVFEYSNGKSYAISRPDGPSSTFLDASPSGDDVFFESYDDRLVPSPNAGDDGVFDARVGGGFPAAASDECTGVSCQPAATPAPALPTAGSVVFLDDDDLSTNAAEERTVSVSKVTSVVGTAGTLKIKVPGMGRLTVTGAGVQTKRLNSRKAQTLTVRLVLTAKASKRLRTKRAVKITVTVRFADAERGTSSTSFAVTFKLASAPPARDKR